MKEQVKEIVDFIKDALQAPTHEANDYNCADWPPGEGCSGCKGDKLREEAIIKLDELLALLSPKGEKPPVLSGQIRDIIEREYATPPIASGKCWEERATLGIAELLEPLIQQVRQEVAREIKGIAKDYFSMGNYEFCQKYLPYIVAGDGRAIAETIEFKYLKG